MLPGDTQLPPVLRRILRLTLKLACFPLLQYLKDLGPEAHGPDAFGNFAIDFAPSAGPPHCVLGAWGPSALNPAVEAPVPVDSAPQQAATMLTSQLHAHALDSAAASPPHPTPAPSPAAQPAPSESVQPPPRATRARRGTAASAGEGRAASGGGRRGSSKESKKELDVKKHLALQEKNRRAQRRFRERQKQRVAELEEQVAALTAQLAAGTAAQGAGPPASDHMQHDGSGPAGPSPLKQEAGSSPRAVVGGPLPAASSQPGSDEDGGLAASLEEGLTLTVREGHPVQLGPRQLADMTPAELARHYKVRRPG
jgi:hypothetical protein